MPLLRLSPLPLQCLTRVARFPPFLPRRGLRPRPPNYPTNDLYERDYRTPWKSITLYLFFLKGFAAADDDDSLETPRGILLEAVELLFARPQGCYLLEYFSMLWFSRSLRGHRPLLPRHHSRLLATR